METPEKMNESGLLADIEHLRGQFPRTQELYQEVCILLFFRHGVTPTANRLYQLVRKGSMSAPTEALNHFWQTLRERSRVTVEHADLPDELKTSAGELVAALWKSAQAASLESLAGMRAQAAAAVDAAEELEAQLKADHAETLDALLRTRGELEAAATLVGQLRQELAVGAATNAVLERRLTELKADLEAGQQRLDEERRAHTAELEKTVERTRLAEERFAGMERRALVEIDRERTAAAKLQKSLESERAAHAVAAERLRTDYNAAQSAIAQSREQIGSLQNAVTTMTEERDRALLQQQEARERVEAAIEHAAAEGARAEQLRDEIARLRTPEALPVTVSLARDQKARTDKKQAVPAKKRKLKAPAAGGSTR